MLNLIRFREQASYPSDHPNSKRSMSGREAYTEYKKSFLHLFTKLGGKIILEAPVECVVTGPASEQFDVFFIAEYPNAVAFLQMLTDPNFKADIVVHRTAGVLDSRLIRMQKGVAKL